MNEKKMTKRYGSRISAIKSDMDKPTASMKGLDDAVSKIGAKTKQGMSDSGSFGSAFKAARAAAIKAGRDPNKEIFTWRGEKKVARMAGAPTTRAASTAKPAIQKRDNTPAAKPAIQKRDNTPAGKPAIQKRDNPPARDAFGSTSVPSLLKRTPGMKDDSSYVEVRSPVTPTKVVNRGAMRGMRQRRDTAADIATKKAQEAKNARGVPEWRDNPNSFATKKFAKGGSIDGCAVRGKTKAR